MKRPDLEGWSGYYSTFQPEFRHSKRIIEVVEYALELEQHILLANEKIRGLMRLIELAPETGLLDSPEYVEAKQFLKEATHDET